MRYMTAGESHGKMLIGLIEGLPAGLTLSFDAIDEELSRRQRGYGRGGRMAIERDRAEIVAGVRGSVTTGAPIAVLIENKDYVNWVDAMDCRTGEADLRTVTCPRPGHADYVGCKKFGQRDARNVLERTSARNTASVVALGAIAKQFLSALNVEIASYAVRIGGAEEPAPYESVARVRERAQKSEVGALSAAADAAMKKEIDRAKESGDTVGGVFRIVVSGMKPGIGSCMEPFSKLDFMLSGAVSGLQGVKAVAIGDAEAASRDFGTQVHDAMFADGQGGVRRETNRAGGLEGGMTNGEDLILTAVFKPIPTTMKGLPSVDLLTGAAATSERERSDVCAVTAAGVAGEAITALVLTEAVLKATGGSTMEEVCSRWNG